MNNAGGVIWIVCCSKWHIWYVKLHQGAVALDGHDKIIKTNECDDIDYAGNGGVSLFGVLTYHWSARLLNL